MRTRIQFILIFLFLLASGVCRASEVVVLLNPTQSISKLSVKELKYIYFGKIKQWENGEPIVLFLPPPKSEAMNFLIKRVFQKKNKAGISKFYLKAIFQQKITRPPEWISSTAEAEYKISVIRGGITFADRKELSKSSPARIVEIEE